MNAVDDAAILWEALHVRRPNAARLALVCSIPVRVTPAFARLARHRLLPGSHTGDEADLWLSELVEVRAAAGFSLHPALRAHLRERLAADPPLLEAVWQQAHLPHAAWLLPRARQEEELTWRLLRDPADPWIADTWDGVLAELQADPPAVGVARWVRRAVPDLPPAAMTLEPVRRAWLGAHLMLGDARVLGEQPQRFGTATGDAAAAALATLAFATRGLPRRALHVALTAEGLLLDAEQTMAGGHRIELPATVPLWVQVERADGEPAAVLWLDDQRPRLHWPTTDRTLHLRLLDGMVWAIEPAEAGAAQAVPADARVRIGYPREREGGIEHVELPFVTGVLADLRGTPTLDRPPVAERRFVEVGRDETDFDRLLQLLQPRLELRLPDLLDPRREVHAELVMRRMADFDAASVAAALEPLQAGLEDKRVLLAAQARMAHDAAFVSEVARALRAGKWRDDRRASRGRDVRRKDTEESGPSVAALLDAARPIAQAYPKLGDPADPKATIAEWLHMLERALTGMLHHALRHPDFQRLESTWRGLHHLAARLPDDGSARLQVLDLARDELAAALGSAPPAEDDPDHGVAGWPDRRPLVWRAVVDEPFGSLGGLPFGALVADYAFGDTDDDVPLLTALAEVGAEAQLPVLTGAAASRVGLPRWFDVPRATPRGPILPLPPSAAWSRLRHSVVAPHLCLLLPRLLVRPPPDEASGVEGFAFPDRRGPEADADDAGWMQPAYALAANIKRSFAADRWCARIVGADGGGRVDGLPPRRIESPRGSLARQGPIEWAIDDASAGALAREGLTAVALPPLLGQPVFQALHTLDQGAAEGATQGGPRPGPSGVGSLPALLCAARVALTLRCMLRDAAGSTTPDALAHAERWLAQYVASDPAELSASRPLAEGRLVVEGSGPDGRATARLSLHPGYGFGDGRTVRFSFDWPLAADPAAAPTHAAA